MAVLRIVLAECVFTEPVALVPLVSILGSYNYIYKWERRLYGFEGIVSLDRPSTKQIILVVCTNTAVETTKHPVFITATFDGD